MKLVFVSNFLNHHQIPICEELQKLVTQFWFIATEKGQSQGYQKSTDAEYVIDYEEEKELAERFIVEADAVIFGACPNRLVDLRMKEDKLSFIYSERFLKKGEWRRFIPRTRNHIIDRVVKHKDKQLYVLCASGFLPKDLEYFGFPKEKCYKWGYFPFVPCEKSKERKENTILWVGRLIPLKHPEIPILVAEKLSKKGYSFTLNIVGEGPEKEKLFRLIKSKNLESCVKLLGSKDHDELMEIMSEHEIFMFTSNRLEGWGAVLNEAMGNGCATVSSDAIGSVPFLIKNGENGLTFKSTNVRDAYKKVQMLLENKDVTKRMGKKAQKDIETLWNYKTAAQRLICLMEELNKTKNAEIYTEGPCSKA